MSIIVLNGNFLQLAGSWLGKKAQGKRASNFHFLSHCLPLSSHVLCLYLSLALDFCPPEHMLKVGIFWVDFKDTQNWKHQLHWKRVMVQHDETELRIANEGNIWRGKQRVGEENYLLLNADYGQGSIFGFLQLLTEYSQALIFSPFFSLKKPDAYRG